MVIRVTWLSRHPMGADQLLDLAATLGCKIQDIHVTQDNVTWQASSDVEADLDANVAIWSRLLITTDIIAGVFPPVALETRPKGLTLLSPVSRQSKAVREDGSAVIEFHHVRWARF